MRWPIGFGLSVLAAFLVLKATERLGSYNGWGPR